VLTQPTAVVILPAKEGLATLMGIRLPAKVMVAPGVIRIRSAIRKHLKE
jgi:hypothetical protein